MSNERRASVHRLIEEGRLDTVYQPIWDLNRMTLLGVEALTRPHPDYGLSGPAEAFDIAEQIGRVHQLDVLAITNALTIAPQLPDGALLFLNLCPQTLDLDLDGNDWLLEASAAAGLPPERIVIEVTERFEGRPSAVAKSLRRLADQGFKIAIDDVGAGNSGLEMLRQVNADYVKLDRSIVAAAATEAGARAVLMALATFALPMVRAALHRAPRDLGRDVQHCIRPRHRQRQAERSFAASGAGRLRQPVAGEEYRAAATSQNQDRPRVCASLDGPGG